MLDNFMVDIRHRLLTNHFRADLTVSLVLTEMRNWSKNLGNPHSHLNLKGIAIRNSHSDVNFQNSILIRIPIP